VKMACTLALCKFMCVNTTYCDEHLQLLFTLLSHGTDAAVRANLAVALGGTSSLHCGTVG